MVVPVEYEPSSEARYIAAPTTSSGSARRCKGTRRREVVDGGLALLRALAQPLGQHATGGDGVDPDAVGRQLGGHATHEVDHPRLGRAVVGEVREGDHADLRRGEHDRALALLHHVLGEGLPAVERSVEVQVDQRHPVGGFDLEERGPQAQRSSSVGEEHVDRSAGLDAQVEGLADQRWVSDVTVHRGGRGAAGGELTSGPRRSRRRRCRRT